MITSIHQELLEVKIKLLFHKNILLSNFHALIPTYIDCFLRHMIINCLVFVFNCCPFILGVLTVNRCLFQHSLEQWAEWLNRVVEQVLQPHQGRSDFSKAARQFLLKWSFYSSMIIRDLTLRSAASFGSFHLIRLLYDEYMFYLVEHKVADATGKSPLAVMAEVSPVFGF